MDAASRSLRCKRRREAEDSEHFDAPLARLSGGTGNGKKASSARGGRRSHAPPGRASPAPLKMRLLVSVVALLEFGDRLSVLAGLEESLHQLRFIRHIGAHILRCGGSASADTAPFSVC